MEAPSIVLMKMMRMMMTTMMMEIMTTCSQVKLQWVESYGISSHPDDDDDDDDYPFSVI